MVSKHSILSAHKKNKVAAMKVRVEKPAPPEMEESDSLKWFKNDALPGFAGEDPIGWISKAERFFEEEGIRSSHKTQWAFMRMEGVAQDWFFSWCQEDLEAEWKSFAVALIRRFKEPEPEKSEKEEEGWNEDLKVDLKSQNSEPCSELSNPKLMLEAMDSHIERTKEDSKTKNDDTRNGRTSGKFIANVAQSEVVKTEVENDYGGRSRAVAVLTLDGEVDGRRDGRYDRVGDDRCEGGGNSHVSLNDDEGKPLVSYAGVTMEERHSRNQSEQFHSLTTEERELDTGKKESMPEEKLEEVDLGGCGEAVSLEELMPEESPATMLDGGATLAKALQARRTGISFLSLAVMLKDREWENEIRADWIFGELGFWTETMGQAQYFIITPPQLINNRRSLQGKSELDQENGVGSEWNSKVVDHVSLLMGQAQLQVSMFSHFNRKREVLEVIRGMKNRNSHLCKMLADAFICVWGYNNTNMSSLTPQVHQPMDKQAWVIKKGGANTNYEAQTTVISTCDQLFSTYPLFSKSIGLPIIVERGEWSHNTLSSFMDVKTMGRFGTCITDFLKEFALILGVAYSKNRAAAILCFLFKKTVENRAFDPGGSSSISCITGITKIDSLETTYGGQTELTLHQSFDIFRRVQKSHGWLVTAEASLNLVQNQKKIEEFREWSHIDYCLQSEEIAPCFAMIGWHDISMVEHLIKGTEFSKMSLAETHHKQWDPGELYSASCIIGTSCFKLWDPGGRPLSLVFFRYLHLEDKVNFKGGSIDENLALPNRFGKVCSRRGRIGINYRIRYLGGKSCNNLAESAGGNVLSEVHTFGVS